MDCVPVDWSSELHLKLHYLQKGLWYWPYIVYSASFITMKVLGVLEQSIFEIQNACAFDLD